MNKSFKLDAKGVGLENKNEVLSPELLDIAVYFPLFLPHMLGPFFC